jgi:hypothetical protein
MPGWNWGHVGVTHAHAFAGEAPPATVVVCDSGPSFGTLILIGLAAAGLVASIRNRAEEGALERDHEKMTEALSVVAAELETQEALDEERARQEQDAIERARYPFHRRFIP